MMFLCLVIQPDSVYIYRPLNILWFIELIPICVLQTPKNWLKYFFGHFQTWVSTILKEQLKPLFVNPFSVISYLKKQKQHLKTSKKSENSQVKIHNNKKTPLNYHSGSFLNYVTLIWLKFNIPASSIMPKLQFFCYLYDIILQLLNPSVPLLHYVLYSFLKFNGVEYLFLY